MISVAKGRGKGQWWPVKIDGVIHANYYCKNCGKPLGLQNHQINTDGTIIPSVVCEHPIYSSNAPTPELSNIDMRCPAVKCGKCDFHDSIKLVGWE